MLSELLSTCGLNDTEQTIFVELYSRGAASAAVLAKRTGIKRPTVYSSLANLASRGIVITQKRRGATTFSLVEHSMIPSILKTRAEDRLREVIDAATRLPLYLDEIDAHQKLAFGDFEVNVLENIDAIYVQLTQALESGGFSAIVNPQLAFVGKGREITKRFLDRSAKLHPKIREIIVSGPVADWYTRNIRNPSHAVRVLPESSQVTSDIVIGDGFVVVSHYSERRELGMKIRHAGFHRTMSEMFDRMWGSLEPFSARGTAKRPKAAR